MNQELTKKANKMYRKYLAEPAAMSAVCSPGSDAESASNPSVSPGVFLLLPLPPKDAAARR